MLRARAASTSQPQEMKVSVCDSQTFEPTPTFPLWPALAPLGSLTSRPRNRPRRGSQPFSAYADAKLQMDLCRQ